jgi:nucleotide-binding universal stress UspA family protein
MFARILVAVQDFEQGQTAVDLARNVGTEGVSQVRVLHLRTREVSGYSWYARESQSEASFVAEAATFELRMAGLAAGSGVRYAAVDRVAEAIVAEAKAFDADLIVLGRPKRGEALTRLFGSVTLRVMRRSACPVLVASRRARPGPKVGAPDASAGRQS